MVKNTLYRWAASFLLFLVLSACSNGVVLKREGIATVSQKLPRDTPVIWVVPDDVSFYVMRKVPKLTIPPNRGLPPVSPELEEESDQFFSAAFLSFSIKVKSELALQIRTGGSTTKPEVFLVVSPIRGGYKADKHEGGLNIETIIKDRKTAQNLWSVTISVPYAARGDDPKLWDRYLELLLAELRKTGWL